MWSDTLQKTSWWCLPDNLIFVLFFLIFYLSLLDSLGLSGGGGSDDGETGVGEEPGVGGVGEGGGGHVAGDVLEGPGDHVVQAVLSLLQLDLLGIGRGGGVNRLEGSGLVSQGLGWIGIRMVGQGRGQDCQDHVTDLCALQRNV